MKVILCVFPSSIGRVVEQYVEAELAAFTASLPCKSSQNLIKRCLFSAFEVVQKQAMVSNYQNNVDLQNKAFKV